MPQSTTTSVPTSSFTIKASYAGDIRRFTLCNISFQDLIAQLIEIFKFPTTVEIDIKVILSNVVFVPNFKVYIPTSIKTKKEILFE